MDDNQNQDDLFRKAVSAIDEGHLGRLEQILTEYPSLVGERLISAGDWLRNRVGHALDGFFLQPYLLWFVAEDPVRNNRLPQNIADLAAKIIEVGEKTKLPDWKAQIDYALRLVAWSWVARKFDVQIKLLDVLLRAGASPDVANDALVNGNFEAAEHLIYRGGKLTLASALCLGYWDKVPDLAEKATEKQKQFSLILAALNGQSEAIRRLIPLGLDLNMPSEDLYPHGTPLHHAASSGSLESVQLLVDAGANMDSKDSLYGGTPRGWAEFANHVEIVTYLRAKLEPNSSS
jgi:ankyrin repeat protein